MKIQFKSEESPPFLSNPSRSRKNISSPPLLLNLRKSIPLPLYKGREGGRVRTMVTLREGHPPINSYNPLIMCSSDKSKTLYFLCHNAYVHRTYDGGNTL